MLALETRICEPLDANAVADFDRRVGGVCANGYDIANSFVPTNEREFGLERPVALAGVQVCVAHASAMQLDETLSWGKFLRLLYWIVVPDLYGRVV